MVKKKGFLNLFKNNKEDTSYSQAVGVLGSGRCGTSMATKAINFIGVDIGNDFVKKNKTNPKGFWENKEIVSIHKKIKEQLGKRPFPEGWEKRQDITPYKNELKKYLETDFIEKPLWGWKDPRTSESIALWKDILKELNIKGTYLIMVRNPIDVAASYKEAYERKENSAINQWQMRTLLSLKGTNGENRIIVDYDDFLSNSLECLRKISEKLDLKWPKEEKKLKKSLDDFIDPNLQHNRTTLDQLMNNNNIDINVRELYKLCLEAAESPNYADTNDFNQKVEGLYKSYLNA